MESVHYWYSYSKYIGFVPIVNLTPMIDIGWNTEFRQFDFEVYISVNEIT